MATSHSSTTDAAATPSRFVAVGDSFTEGLHDVVGATGRHLGWADRVADAMARQRGGLAYANLAVRGRLLAEVVAEQVPVALDLAPDLVSFHAGANDVLRPRLAFADLLDAYTRAVRTLRAGGATVVLFTVIGRSGGRGPVADGLVRRFAAFNHHVRVTASQLGAEVVDLGAVRALQDPRLWHEDRLHLNAAGHQRVAAAVLEVLGTTDQAVLGGPAGWWREPLPGTPAPARREVLATEARWVGRHLLPWVGRRVRGVSSGDTVEAKHPTLVDLQVDGKGRPSHGTRADGVSDSHGALRSQREVRR